MKLTYAITVYNELEELTRLLNVLEGNSVNVLVQVDDVPDQNGKVLEFLKDWELTKESTIKLKHVVFPLNDNFAKFKNNLSKNVDTEYIFQIDADEYPSESLITEIEALIESNPVDLIWVPRVNIVEGITQEDINRWHWQINDSGWINYPDYQSRIYKVDPGIKWARKVHEIITGVGTYAKLPPNVNWSLIHKKKIDKQRQQNDRYSRMIKL